MMEVLKIHLFGGHLAQKSTCSKKKKQKKQTNLRVGKVPHYNTISGASRRASEAASSS